MDSQFIWLLVLALASPIGAVVGFAIQLRQVKKMRLENEKLQLEIASLKKTAVQSERRILAATTDEVMRISHPEKPMFSRRIPINDHATPTIKPQINFKEILFNASAIALGIIVVGYALYDCYRLVIWLLQRIQ